MVEVEVFRMEYNMKVSADKSSKKGNYFGKKFVQSAFYNSSKKVKSNL